MKDDHIYALRLKKEQIERLDWLKERLDNGCSRISWASIINYAVEELYARECEKALREWCAGVIDTSSSYHWRWSICCCQQSPLSCRAPTMRRGKGNTLPRFIQKIYFHFPFFNFYRNSHCPSAFHCPSISNMISSWCTSSLSIIIIRCVYVMK